MIVLKAFVFCISYLLFGSCEEESGFKIGKMDSRCLSEKGLCLLTF